MTNDEICITLCRIHTTQFPKPTLQSRTLKRKFYLIAVCFGFIKVNVLSNYNTSFADKHFHISDFQPILQSCIYKLEFFCEKKKSLVLYLLLTLRVEITDQGSPNPVHKGR